MEIKELKITNFRGIKSLNWRIDSRIVCLVGPGNSTKSTILAAIALLFSPKWNVPISDVDFYNLEVDEFIEISAVITGFPKEFSQDNKFGLFHCFWNGKDLVHIKEEPNDVPSLVIVFRVDRTLEPTWYVKNLDTEEEKPISASEREKLFVAELGFYGGRDLSWGRYSGLTKLTGTKTTQNSAVALTEISRVARKSFEKENFSDLQNALDSLKDVLIGFGVESKGPLTPGLDPREMNISSGLITAHDNGIPLNVSGLSSRRLVTMAIYHSLAEDGAIFLIDEIETGFEPYRLRKLLDNLKETTNSQSFFTSHSVIPILELADNGIFIVRNKGGLITINQLDKELVPIGRAIPEVFLSRVIVMCEGKTEWGLLKSVNQYWSNKKRELEFGTSGVEPAYHKSFGGSAAPQIAELLKKSGFTTAFFGDSDCDTNPSHSKLSEIGVEVFIWPDNVCTEQRICLDIPKDGLKEMMSLAGEIKKNDDILSNVKRMLSENGKDIDLSSEKWEVEDENQIRKILGKVFSKCGSFKDESHSIRLGELLLKYLDEMIDTPTYTTLNRLIEWSHDQSS